MNNPKKAIVFGGGGFLGGHVAEELRRQNYLVTSFDKKHTHNSFTELKNNPIKIINGDILSKEDVEEACKNHDYIYNFAAMADINKAKDLPKETMELNIIGNINILDAAIKHQAKRFVFASSVYVYSNSGSFYRVSKQASEEIIELYHQKFGLNFTILRYGSLYGRKTDNSNTIHRFIWEGLTKNQISYHGTGNELREYIHAEDAAKVSIDILKPEYVNEHLILTGPRAMRVRDVMEMIGEILPNDPSLIFKNTHQEEHYKVTPYAYRPRPGRKIVANPFVDMGQGILDCIYELVEKREIGQIIE